MAVFDDQKQTDSTKPIFATSMAPAAFVTIPPQEKHTVYKKGMTPQEGVEACRACITELRTRFIINQPVFVAKIVTKDGVQIVPLQ